MKKLVVFALSFAVSTVAWAQSLAVGAGSFAGSGSASQAIAVMAINQATGTGGPVTMGILVNNQGTASANSATPFVVAPAAVVSGGQATSNNTTTIATAVNLPIGVGGGVGGSGAGASFAAAGTTIYLTTAGPIPTPPIILPNPPIFVITPHAF